MIPYPVAPYEQERIQELLSYQILDTESEKEFDDLIQLAAKTFNVPVAVISFIDKDRQWLKAKVGIDICEANREISICNHTLLQSDLLEINDLSIDDRCCFLPHVACEGGFRFYAGYPLITKKGFRIGVICLLDTAPRILTKDERNTLQIYARNVMTHVELKKRNLELENLTGIQNRISCTLSHDIRNPLSTLKMMLDLQDEADHFNMDEETAMINKLLKEQVENTLSLLGNMIEWGKLQMGERQSRLKTISLKAVVKDCINEIKLDGILKGNMFINEIPSDILVDIDYYGFCFALRNLLTNANKFTDNGSIKVSYIQCEDVNYLSVTDTGVGMPQRQVDALNNNRSTLYSHGTRNEKSNGLGLGLVNEYLQKNNSNLQFTSYERVGTTVQFRL